MAFKTYIQEKFFDILFERVKSFIITNRETIDFRLRRIDEVKYVEVNDITIENFYVKDLKNYNLGFTMRIVADCDLSNYYKGEYYHETDYHSFLVKCEAHLDETKISNFKVTHIEDFVNIDKGGNGLTDTLVPYIYKEDMDKVATEILMEIYPEALNGEVVDPYKFADRLGLTVVNAKFKNKDVMGKIYFEEHRSKKMKDGQIKEKITPKNTIKINENLSLLNFETTKAFTIMHECVHYVLHRKVFLLQKILKSESKYISCPSSVKDILNPPTTDVDWMEWQANNLAPRLLMPAEVVKKMVDTKINDYSMNNETNDLLDYYEPLIKELANYFGVTIETVKIRLIELGYDFPLGCFVIIDDKKVRAHGFARGSLNKNETYSVGILDAARFFIIRRFIQNDELIDNFLYVESHMCINSPKYIKYIDDIPYLTDYARRNMDECCIKFELSIPNVSHYEIDYSTYKTLSRKKGVSDLVINGLPYESKGCNINMDELIKSFNLTNELNDKMTNNVQECLKRVREYSENTIQELSDKTGISLTTFNNYFYKSENQSYSKDILVKILIAMNTPPYVSRHILSIAGCSLGVAIEKDMKYNFALSNLWTSDYSTFENFLEYNDNELNEKNPND